MTVSFDYSNWMIPERGLARVDLAQPFLVVRCRILQAGRWGKVLALSSPLVCLDISAPAMRLRALIEAESSR
ncbi:hypothetical protein XH86_04225 [Bradyrhizobium guangdongense]|uniref:Uncharacterized protein n=1 Tax=Bradyrhizobium guangdongense TaxID=1325090 RepID=A0A7S7ZPK6_9BRAD|nr:hypothetical protein XH86_04225 [Bradyrhizobium guangdongense]